MKHLWIFGLLFFVVTVATGCDSDDARLTAYQSYLAQFGQIADDVEDEVDDEDFVIPGQIFLNPPTSMGSSGGTMGASIKGDSMDLGADDWLIGIWSVSQEATFTGTLVVGFRPNEDNTEVEAFLAIADERGEGEHTLDFMVYVADILAESPAINFTADPSDDTLVIDGISEPTTVIDQCPGVSGRPALKLERADVSFYLDMDFGDFYLEIPEQPMEAGIDNFQDGRMGIITFQRCHDKDFHFEHREFLGLRRMSEGYEEFAGLICEGEFAVNNAKGEPLPTACNGDFSDDRMVIEFPIDGSTESADYLILLAAAADVGELFGSDIMGSGYSEEFQFTCLSASGCDNATDVAAGLAAEINANSRLATAGVGTYTEVLNKGAGVPSVVVTARAAGWPLVWEVDDDETGDMLAAEVTNEGGMDLQLFSTFLSQVQLIGLELEGTPESVEDLLPEEPKVNESARLEGHLVVGCDNYPDGYVEGSVAFDLLYTDSEGPTGWFPMASDWIFDYINCEIRFDDFDPFGVDGRPRFYLEGTFANFLEFDNFPFGEETSFVSFDSEAMGMGFGWNPAAAMTAGQLTGDPVPVFFEPGAESSRVDVDMRTTYIIGSGPPVFVSADGGVCVEGALNRNRDGSGNDFCLDQSGEGDYAPPLFSYLIGSCTISPGGGGPGAFAPLLLAVGAIFGLERRRRKGERKA